MDLLFEQEDRSFGLRFRWDRKTKNEWGFLGGPKLMGFKPGVWT